MSALPLGRQRSFSWLLGCVLAILLALSLLQSSGIQVAGSLTSHAAQFPALPADLSHQPLGTPAPAPAGSGGYTVLEHEDDGSGRPVRWDPCRPIHYVVRTAGAPPGGAQAIASSIALLSKITGFQFIFDGDTTEAPAQDRPTIQTARYGDRWAPVLVAWTDPQEYPEMSDYAGLGGPDAVSGRVPGRRRYVSGVVLLNKDYLDQTVQYAGGQQRLDAVVLHEFGHLAGLDHVNDPSQLMYKQPTPKPGGYADGDRRGLAALSDGPCFRDY